MDLTVRTTFLLIVAVVIPFLKTLSDCMNNLTMNYCLKAYLPTGIVIGLIIICSRMGQGLTVKKNNLMEKVFYIILPIVVMAELYWTGGVTFWYEISMELGPILRPINAWRRGSELVLMEMIFLCTLFWCDFNPEGMKKIRAMFETLRKKGK